MLFKPCIEMTHAQCNWFDSRQGNKMFRAVIRCNVHFLTVAIEIRWTSFIDCNCGVSLEIVSWWNIIKTPKCVSTSNTNNQFIYAHTHQYHTNARFNTGLSIILIHLAQFKLCDVIFDQMR